jgi:hypothetical protein
MLRDVDQAESGATMFGTGLREEAQELGTLGLLGEATDDDAVVRAGTTIRGSDGLVGVPMGLWRLADHGRLLVDVARLDEIPTSERDEVLTDLLA